MNFINYIGSILLLITISFESSGQHFWKSANFPSYSHIYALYDDSVSGNLFIGGKIPSTGGSGTKGFAYYNDTALIVVSNSTQLSPVSDFVRYSGQLYIAGGGNVKIWHGGDSVSIPGGGIQGAGVECLMVHDDFLYAFGKFTKAGSIDITNNMAKWDGNTWSTVGDYPSNNNGFQINTILTAAFYNDEIYIGGIILDSIENVSLLKGDGNSFTLPDNGIRGVFADVESFAVWEDTLYVGGLFSKSDGNRGNGIMQWDGQNWHEVGGGITDGLRISQLSVINNRLYAGGAFNSLGGVTARSIGYWNRHEWCSLGGEFDNTILSLEFHNDSIWVGGAFDLIQDDSIHSVAKWAGNDHTDSCGNIIANSSEANNGLGKISVYPNPTSKDILVSFSQQVSESIVVFDMHGNVLQQRTIKSGERLDISTFTSGIYVLAIRDKRIKIIKQ